MDSLPVDSPSILLSQPGATTRSQYADLEQQQQQQQQHVSASTSTADVEQLHVDPSLPAAPAPEEDNKALQTVPEPPAKKKRNRKPVTCLQCRKRKLKCDRNDPCGACKERKEGHLCEWEGAIRVPQSTQTREQEAQDLRAQVNRLETLIGSLASLTGRVTNGSTSSSLIAPPAALMAPSSLGATSSSLARVGDEMETSSAVEALGLLATSQRGSSAPQQYALQQIFTQMPARETLVSAAETYSNSCQWWMPFFHGPTFIDHVRAFKPAQEPHFTAFVLAVVAWTSALAPRATLMDQARSILSQTEYIDDPSLDAVRTLLVLHQYELHHQRLTTAEAHLSVAIDLAFRLSLNRDPSLFPGLNAIETEERRRLWLYIVTRCELDSTPRKGGRARTWQADTRPPSSVWDYDLHRDGCMSLPINVPTPVQYVLLSNKLAEFSARSSTLFSIEWPPSWSTIEGFNTELEELASFFVEKTAPNGIPGADIAQLRVELWAQRIRINRPFLSRGFIDQRFAKSRERCCQAARFTLAQYQTMSIEPPFDIVGSILIHALNAACILALDVFQDPDGTFASLHRNDVMTCIASLSAATQPRPIITQTLAALRELLNSAGMVPVSSRKRRANGEQAWSAAYGGGGGSSVAAAPDFDPNEPFALPLPVPVSAEPMLAPESMFKGAGITGVWRDLVKYEQLYALPDANEWSELQPQGGTSSWIEEGIDLIFVDDDE